jgi:hypothetical protein
MLRYVRVLFDHHGILAYRTIGRWMPTAVTR